MSKSRQKVIVILGQTATGKSDFAVEIAKLIGGEIISADSRQVYKGLDIGSGKITKKEMRGVPHHLLDVASPTRTFTVADFKKKAEDAIKQIVKNEKIPIICGGTGFYIDSLVSGQTLPEVAPDKKLRATLEKKSIEELFKILKKLDAKRAKDIDKNNPVRIIRAIEIATAIGKVPKLSKNKNTQKYNIIYIGLTLPDEILKEKICIRLLARIKDGMIKEVENLHKNGLSWKRLNDLGLEYRYVSGYIQSGEYIKNDEINAVLKQDWVQKLNSEIWHYAKRQKTWFKRNKDIIWIDPREVYEKAKALYKIKKFLE